MHNWNQPLAASFSVNHKLAAIQIDILALNAAELGNSHAGGEKGLKQGYIPNSKAIRLFVYF